MNDFLARTQEGAAALRRAVTDISARPQLLASVREEPAVGAGVLAGAIAQVEKARTLTRPSVLGVAAVTASHAAYAWSLYRRGARNDALGWGLRAAAWGAGVAATRTQPTAAAVAVGGAAVLVTSALAGDPALRTDAGKGMSHGANLLLASEALTVLNPAEQRQDAGLRGRVLDAAQSAAQTVGLVLLVDGLARKGRG